MQKKFNITGTCIPEKHYMVNIDNKLKKMILMIEDGEYFTVNRPRQYGKTTTLYMLSRALKKREDYLVIKLSFEGMGDERYSSEKSFIEGLFIQFKRIFLMDNENQIMQLIAENKEIKTLDELGVFITELVLKSRKKVVLIIDEIDKNSDNQLFLNFLGMLRNKYLLRSEGEDFTFQSVILAGVHDVKNLKLKLRKDEKRKYNSPWNIAVDFNMDMSFSKEEIGTMLQEYSYETGMEVNLEYFSERIHYYTSGYPFLVSRLCKIIDEEILMDNRGTWKEIYLEQALSILLKESNTNFDSLIKNLQNNNDLYNIVYKLIIEGNELSYNSDNPIINLATTYGIFKEMDRKVKIHNRIYEQRIYNYMISKVETSTDIKGYNFRDNFLLPDNSIDFEKVLLKFQEFMKKEYSTRDKEFLEKNGRLIFLAFIKPIINGVGFDFKEIQISEEKRLDVVITYLSKMYVIEMKIWRGQAAHERGIKQLCDYLDVMTLSEGFLVIFDFTKQGNKNWKKERLQIEGKDIFMIWI
ncbi:AAA family ATPase [Clostridium magnum]|nr:AAA family ATPase [Clostridium magnum]SHI25505.1 Predicted AAA-ATPase [Clostridium magnum DSM 2767]